MNWSCQFVSNHCSKLHYRVSRHQRIFMRTNSCGVIGSLTPCKLQVVRTKLVWSRFCNPAINFFWLFLHSFLKPLFLLCDSLAIIPMISSISLALLFHTLEFHHFSIVNVCDEKVYPGTFVFYCYLYHFCTLCKCQCYKLTFYFFCRYLEKCSNGFYSRISWWNGRLLNVCSDAALKFHLSLNSAIIQVKH